MTRFQSSIYILKHRQNTGIRSSRPFEINIERTIRILLEICCSFLWRFEEKKQPKLNATGEKIRNGYADGSHSEIEVSQLSSWGPEQVKERGMKLLTFMAQRWGFIFKNDAEKENILYLK